MVANSGHTGFSLDSVAFLSYLLTSLIRKVGACFVVQLDGDHRDGPHKASLPYTTPRPRGVSK